jgi:hypothetical protein
MKHPPLLMFATGLLCLNGAATAQTPEERARAAAAASRARTADSDALQANYLGPGLAGQPIATISGSQSFTTTIACQKTASFIELLVQPQAGGDIGTLTISRDENLDGAFDKTMNVPVPVSGICANGIISCQVGSWNACQSFKWDVDGAGDLKLSAVALPELAGCYCVNDSCGSNLVWGNLASVLKDLGGGVIGALTTADPRIGVAQSLISGPTIRYVGAQTTACTSSPSVPQTAYRANPAVIQSDAVLASQSSSVFQALSASPAGTGKAQSIRSCSIAREVTVKEVRPEDIIERTNGGYATYSASPDTVTFLMGSPSYHSLVGGGGRLFDFHMTLNVQDEARLLGIWLTYYMMDDWMQLRIDGKLVHADPASWIGAGNPPGKFERGQTWYGYPNLDLKPYLTAGSHDIWLRMAVGGEGEVSLRFDAQLDTSCEVDEKIVDLCSGYAGDPQCELQSEDVDGVVTFTNGAGTGLRPLPSTRLFGTGTCTWQITRPFYLKDRKYICRTDTGSPTAPDLSRGAYIIDHSTETLLADRTTDKMGNVTTSTRTFGMPSTGSVPTCEAICKTRAPKANADAAPDGVVGSKQTDRMGWDTFYHACSADDVCPIGPGEEIVSGCGCLDDFPEAMAMMQTVRLSGADMICTAVAR